MPCENLELYSYALIPRNTQPRSNVSSNQRLAGPGLSCLAFSNANTIVTLEQIKNLGMTTIIVEQNAIAALHLADRAIILDMGQVVFDGTAQEVLDNEELRHEYLAI